MAALGRQTLLSLYHHVVLPRHVPGREDEDLYVVETELVRRLAHAVKSLAGHADPDDMLHLDVVRLALSTCGALNIDGKIDRTLLVNELRQLNNDQNALILHATEQNAALLIYPDRHNNNTVIFEVFETSATSESVLEAENALVWDFPGQAVAIPCHTVMDVDFQRSFSALLEQASVESIKQFSAVTYKACAPLPEVRNTSDPALISGALMAILEANGTEHETTLLRKRVRDSVSFDKASRPWRRSAFYLVLRVAIQRHLYNLLGSDKGRLYYKMTMCLFMCHLLRDGLDALPHDALHLLRQKLGRRLAKLSLDHDRGSKVFKDLHKHVCRTLRLEFKKTLESVGQAIESHWEAHKRRTTRVIRPIQAFADTSDMTLRLSRSGQYLTQAMQLAFNTSQAEERSAAELLGHYNDSKAFKPFVAITNRYLRLFAYEEVSSQVTAASDLACCTRLAQTIETYVANVQDAYVDYPELRSRQLLNLLNLWMQMDSHAVKCYPLLTEYHPGFEAGMLDVLQLSTVEDVRRLQALQTYVSKRCSTLSRKGSKTIFDPPEEDSFAARYYEESGPSSALCQLREQIEEEAQELLDDKEEEWEEKSDAHESKMREMAGLSCVYITEFDECGIEQKVHKKGCHKHRLKWEAKQIKIDVLEHPLPKLESARRAVIFELSCPEAFAAYRDATWLILSTFAFPTVEQSQAGQEPAERYLLRDYEGLKQYANSTKSKVTLGSATKSHLDSHYAESGFPVDFAGICRAFGLRVNYYDESTRSFTQRQETPSFAHLFPLKLSSNSSYHIFKDRGSNWPTSNKILSTQTQCPKDVNIHEYMAWQGVLVGSYSRWPALLREMGSSNLNFSTDSTWAVISRLVLEVGPAASNSEFGETHSILRDLTFCRRLLDQIEYRLDAIHRNWREPVQMDLLITILFRVLTFASEYTVGRADISGASLMLLSKAQKITQDWCATLRAAEHDSGSEPSVFAIWAAVLFKRTVQCTMAAKDWISQQSMVDFLVASISLQNCLIGAFETLPYNLRNAVLRDLDYCFSIRKRLERAIRSHPAILLRAVQTFWPVPAECMENEPTSSFNTQEWWISTTLSMNYTGAQNQQHCNYIHLHYNYVHGTLLINGEQLGILPLEYQRWDLIKELFGSQSLRTYPSPLPGMSVAIARQMPHEHWVHLGFRNNQLVIRALQQGTVLELISPLIFGDHRHYDLPATLAIQCYHWLNLHTGQVEIRQFDPWKSKKGNWRLDLRTRRATRNNASTLVDPNSELARKITQNFHWFEFPYHITVYQPQRGKLRVELKRLGLDFVVSQGGLLLCPQLGAFIAESRLQDVGTWYGLKSKLVVRSVKDHNKLSILLPMGDCITEREGSHVSIVIKNNGQYLKFGVNNVLGRVECPAEPVMLYHRALWHASTSHFLPDPLTKSTGVEEALAYLSSGSYYPWTLLSTSSINVLLEIAKFTPSRVYYPSTLKAMESVQWNLIWPAIMQDDRYRRAVEKILQRHIELAQFVNIPGPSDSTPLLSVAGNLHLENRALYRTSTRNTGMDMRYKSRDCRTTGVEHANAAEMAKLIFDWPSHIANTSHLADLLVNTPVIGGYVRLFDKIRLSDILHADLRYEWGALVKSALGLTQQKRFELTFLCSILAFSSEVDMDILRAIVSFSMLSDLKTLNFPAASSYSRYQSGEVPDVNKLTHTLMGAKKPCAIERRTATTEQQMRQLDHEYQATRACKLLAESILAQWPSATLAFDKLSVANDNVLDRAKALDLIQPVWERLVNNQVFSQHLKEVQLVLSRYAPDKQVEAPHRVATARKAPQLYPLRMRGGEIPAIAELLERNIESKVPGTRNSLLRAKPNGHVGKSTNGHSVQPGDIHKGVQPISIRSSAHRGSAQKQIPNHIRELSRLVAPLAASSSLVQKRYGLELQQSIAALSHHIVKSNASAAHEPYNPTQLENDLFTTKESLHVLVNRLRQVLQKDDQRADWLNLVGLWPSVTLTSLLTELRSTSGAKFGAGVRAALVDVGIAVTRYQRLLRIRDAAQSNSTQRLNDERANEGHTNWSPMDYTDWLLLEIEGDIMIRPEQVEVALATISPTSGQNSVLQLLMGKGKTSCILPMVAVMLSHKNLFRVVVPRPLLLQSAQIMQAKLGGLLNREVLHIPFSRKTPTNKTLMQTYCHLHTYAQKNNSIMLALPEHILSFKLSGLQRLCDGKLDKAATMIKAQAWLDRHARDVLDECDVSLAIRTQLIYPSGSQQAVDGHPQRWQTVEALLDLIASYLDDLTTKCPHSIEVVSRSGFPLIYFLRKDVEDYLLEQILQKVARGQTVVLPVATSAPADQQAIYEFISLPVVDEQVTQRIQDMFKETSHLIDVVYHLRGLFVHRILLSTLKKRWNVQYGLSPARDPIAVPYQAKGVPSLTAEWGHPDVAIILTCLSFYYEGLSMAQFRQALEHLAKSNEPSIEFSLWVTEGVPESFKNFNAVNTEDTHQLRELHHQIRYRTALLNYYLNSFVFPQHAKQFSKKLSASGSDLVVFNPTSPSCRVSGFSGTNDTRHQLPMTIKQNDLAQLAHTNAEVLAYLLEDRNRRYVRMVDSYKKRLSEDGLLKKLMHPYGFHWNANPNAPNAPDRLRILIDAGAQILEYDNRSLAKAWLKEDHEAAAAVYFDEDHRARVLYAKGTDIPLVASPFADNLVDCLVYLDESHCRGTDLKLPPNARAAVTLGPHLTKDALVQAAMRLRLLGKTQSVTFFSPPEVHQSILDLRKASRISPQTSITSVDVIRWLLKQTCNGIEQLEPLYFNQGLNYLQRTQACLEHPDFVHNSESRDAYLSVVRSQELQTLKQLYEPKTQGRGAVIKASAFDLCLRAFANELLQRRKGFQDRGLAIHASALEEVEQEREMEFEVEAVREVQAPIHFKAFKVSKLHADIHKWVTTGRMAAGSDGYQPMFYALQKTAIGLQHTITATSTAARLHVSAQFTRTVSVPEANDSFLRPCHWLLLDRMGRNAILVSPEEANSLIPILQHLGVDKTACHLIVYNAPITRRMLQFNDLNYYAIPPLPEGFKAPMWLKVELGIFAGRLYFDWNEYEHLSSYLGSHGPDEHDDDNDTPRPPKEAFATKPLAFLHDWLAVRRKGQDFEHTPMGFVTTGKPLSASHPFFAAMSAEETSSDKILQPSSAHTAPAHDDEESDDDEDHAKEHMFQQNEEGEHGEAEVFHDAEEDWSETENTFLDGKDYVDAKVEADDEE